MPSQFLLFLSYYFALDEIAFPLLVVPSTLALTSIAQYPILQQNNSAYNLDNLYTFSHQIIPIDPNYISLPSIIQVQNVNNLTLQQPYQVNFNLNIEQYNPLSCHIQCSNQGNCINGTCVCNTQYTGNYCQFKIVIADNISQINQVNGWLLITVNSTKYYNFINMTILSGQKIYYQVNKNNQQYPNFFNYSYSNLTTNVTLNIQQSYISSNFYLALFSTKSVNITMQVGLLPTSSTQLSPLYIVLIVVCCVAVSLLLIGILIYNCCKKPQNQLIPNSPGIQLSIIGEPPSSGRRRRNNARRTRTRTLKRFDIFAKINTYMEATNYGEIKDKFNINQQENESNEFQCAICLVEFGLEDQCRLTYCLHLFHQACLDQWLDKHETCPFCRQKITLEVLENEYQIYILKRTKKPLEDKEMESKWGEVNQLLLQYSDLFFEQQKGHPGNEIQFPYEVVEFDMGLSQHRESVQLQQ